MGFSLLAPVLLLASSALADTVVLTVGPDASATAELDFELNRAAGARSIGSTVLAQRLRLAGTSVPATPAPVRARLEELKKRIREDYYQDKRADAARSLDFAEEILVQHGRSLPIREFVHLRLFRAAVLLAEGDETAAAAAARQAIVLQPRLEVDTRIFRPDLFELVSRVREEESRMVRVRLQNLPPDATVRVDDRPVPGAFTARAGRHRVTVVAPGMRARSVWVQLRGASQSISIPLAPAFASADAGWATALLARDAGPEARDRERLAALAQRLQVSRVIVASAASARVVAVRWRSGSPGRIDRSPTFAENREGRQALATWVDENWMAQPRTPVVRPRRSEVRVAVGAAVSARERIHSPTNNAAIRLGWVGVGPQLRVAAAVRQVHWSLETALLTYQFDEENTRLQDGTPAEVSGGRTLSVLATGVYELGGTAAFRVRVGPAVALGLEEHDAEDLRGPNGPANLLPSHRRVHLDAGLRARLPLGKGGAFAGETWLVAAGYLTPYTYWKQVPSDTLGTDPSPALAGSWQVQLQVHGKSWGGRLEYHGGIRSVRHSGPALLATTPPLEDITLQESFHRGVISLTRAF